MRGGLDANGKVVAWSGAFFYPQGGAGNVALVGSDLAGLPSDSGLNPGNVINDTAIPYRIAERSYGCPSACLDTSEAVLDPYARPHAEHLRQ